MEYRPINPPENNELSFVGQEYLNKANDMLEYATLELETIELQGHVTGFAGSYNKWLWDIKCYKKYINSIENIIIKIERDAL